MEFEILKVCTINVAIRDASQAGRFFESLGLAVPFDEPVNLEMPPAQIRYVSAQIDGGSLSFVEPSSDDSPIARFLDRRGGGMFSLSLEVRGLHRMMSVWGERGEQWVLDEPIHFEADPLEADPPADPRSGVINWTRPAATPWFLIEVIECSRTEHSCLRRT